MVGEGARVALCRVQEDAIASLSTFSKLVLEEKSQTGLMKHAFYTNST